MLYRTPTDSAQESERFYQGEYEQGSTTELPREDELKRLLKSGAASLPTDHTLYLKLFDSLNLGVGARVLDYGCSWGYGTYQFKNAGMEVAGFEISRVRAAYARDKMGLKVRSNIEDLGCDFDVFFSSHVLEHVANLREVLCLARKLTRPGGIFLSLTPNASPEFRLANPKAFHRLWGLTHPNLIQAKFAWNAFGDRPLLLGSAPYPVRAISAWNRSDLVKADVSGWELVIIAIL